MFQPKVQYIFKRPLENDIPSTTLLLAVTGVFFRVFSCLNYFDTYLRIVFGAIAAFLIIASSVIVKQRQFIVLTSSDLRVVTTFFSIRFEKTYLLEHIKNLSYKKHVKSDSYTSSGHAKILGVDVTPESMKEYYYHHEILQFDYEGRKIELGKWKKSFDGDQLFQLILQEIL